MAGDVFSVTEIVVRYQETDQMGVAHHSVYPVWFEVGRTDFMRKFGIPYGRLEADGLFLPLIELKCAYKSFARYEDKLTVRTRIAGMTKIRLNFSYEVLREEAEVLREEANGAVMTIATGTTYHVFADAELRPVNLQKYRPALYEMFASL